MNAFDKYFEEAQKYIAKGLNSPFRSFEEVGGVPIFMNSGKGSKLSDARGNEYIDYSLAWGPMILGHAHQAIRSTIEAVSKNGWCFGTPTETETVFAKKIIDIFPFIGKIRLTNSGTEAVMSAVRLARGYTKKEKLIVFDGHYHGHSNDTLVGLENGNKVLSSLGVPSHVLQLTLVAKYNDIASVEKLLAEHADVAAILVEPVATNMGVVLPQNDFLKKLRLLCDRHNCLLIFDEVVTGLRVSLGGAQAFYGVTADIIVLGKALAGGLPIGAFGARNEIMEILSPKGFVYVAGTFAGNPMTTNCGITALDVLSGADVFENLITKTSNLCEDLKEFVREHQLPVVLNHAGSIFSLFFTSQEKVETYEDVKKCDFSKFARYFHYLLERGIYLSPSGKDSSFLSTAHTDQDIKYTAKIIKSFLLTLKK